jgi:hypothetical protein
VDRLTSDREMDQTLGSRHFLSEFLEAAIQLEGIYLKALEQTAEEFRELVEEKPQSLEKKSVVVATCSRPSVLNPDPRAIPKVTSLPNSEIQLDGHSSFSRDTALVRPSAVSSHVREAFSRLPSPEETVTISVWLCAVCSGFLNAKRASGSGAEEYTDDDDYSPRYSESGSDDNPAEDWQSDDND